ncbi:MAG: glutathione peroxidase [Chitinophagales bacterium]
MDKTVYDFPVADIHGNQFDFSKYKGKKILLVNTASACGLTPQYKQLEELQQNFKDKLVVIGLPCNDFGAQEPGSEEEIARFCEMNFQVSFPLMSKIKVLGGQQHPLYQFLTQKKLNGCLNSEVKWNFQKYLINESGYLTHVYSPLTEPLSDEIINDIDN